MVGRSAIQTGTGHKFSSALLFAVGTIATLLTVAGFFGGRWWALDTLADWRFALFVVLTVTAILYGLVFRRALSAVFLLAAVVNGALLAPLWLGAQVETVADDWIRLVTFDDDGPNDVRRAVVDWINGEEADVAIVFNTSAWWADTLDVTGAPYSIVGMPDDERSVGTLVLARRGTTVTMTPTVEGADITLSVTKGSQRLSIIGMAELKPISGYEAEQRIERFSAVNAAALEAGEPVVVAGNFATSRWSHAFGHLAEGLTNSESGFGYVATWPSITWPIVGPYIGLPMDHALYAGDITVPRREIGPDLGASHLPLLVDVAPVVGG
jgi:endonuclease/exonuclease/phosphatase (EEP) superfamily protein YafD